jgi:hypothetical protein
MNLMGDMKRYRDLGIRAPREIVVASYELPAPRPEQSPPAPGRAFFSAGAWGISDAITTRHV